jgi:hypothetical protein
LLVCAPIPPLPVSARASLWPVTLDRRAVGIVLLKAPADAPATSIIPRKCSLYNSSSTIDDERRRIG